MDTVTTRTAAEAFGGKYLVEVFSFFKDKQKDQLPLRADIHSHLLPGLDDGVQTAEESLDIIRELAQLGYKKAITTPHVMSDSYRNTSEGIRSALSQMQQELLRAQISFELQAAAEYYLDEVLMQKVQDNEPLLTFGSRYLLFETNFTTEPYQLKDFIFAITTQGYKPVLAHPERYQYLINDFGKVQDLRNRGVLFQINIPSLAGGYSKPVQRFAQRLIEEKWVEFLGSDCHNALHLDLTKRAFNNKFFNKALELPLLNREL